MDIKTYVEKRSTEIKKGSPETHADIVANILSDGEEHYASELNNAAGWRFGAAIFNLRKRGIEIKTIRPVDGNHFKYQLDE